MKRSRKQHELYLEHRDKVVEISQHYDDCPQQGRNAPLDVCPCTCYQEQIFLLGTEAQEKGDGPVYKHLDASTGHITEDDSKVLQDNHNLGIRVLSDEYGFFISLAAFMDEEAKEYIKHGASRELSLAFFKLVKYALDNGCNYINLDCDADTIDGLPTFEW